MADATKLTKLSIAQWSRPDAERPRLASPISATATELEFNFPLKDEDGAIITGNCLIGIQDKDGYTESIYIPAAGISASGLVASGVIRGVNLSGLDYSTQNDSTLAVKHNADDPVICQISAVYFEQVVAAIQGIIATGANTFKIGDGTAADQSVVAHNDHTVKPKIYFDDSNESQLKGSRGDDEGAAGDFSIGHLRLTTAERDALTAPLDGMSIFNSTDGVMNFREGGAWVANAAGGSVANASTTVAGKVEEATDAEVIAGTQAGATGARLFINPGSVGTTEGKIPLLGAGGLLPNSTVPAGVTHSYTYGETIAAGEAVGYKTGGDILETQINGLGGSNHDVYGANWAGQTFTIPVGFDKIIGWKLGLRLKTGTPAGNLEVSFRATSSSLPTGADLDTAVTSSANGFTGPNVWNKKLSSAITVTEGTEYAMIWRIPSGTAGNNIDFEYGAYSFAGGQKVTSADSGSTWSADASNDFRVSIFLKRTDDGKIYKFDLDSPTCGTFIGIAKDAGDADDSGEVYDSSGAITSGLTQGSNYYGSETAGSITTTQPDGELATNGEYDQAVNYLYVGRGLSTTDLKLSPKQKFVAFGSKPFGYLNIDNNDGSIFTPLPFRPDEFLVRMVTSGVISTLAEAKFDSQGNMISSHYIRGDQGGAGTGDAANMPSTVADGLAVFGAATTDSLKPAISSVEDYGVWWDFSSTGTPPSASFLIEAIKH